MPRIWSATRRRRDVKADRMRTIHARVNAEKRASTTGRPVRVKADDIATLEELKSVEA